MKREILIVEDNDGDILLLQEAFETSGCQWNLTICKDGEQAIRHLADLCAQEHHNRPDLILLDLNLPRKNGLEVLEFIKENGFLKEIPTVVFSTSSSKKDIDSCYQRHANCYITKPVDIDNYQRTIQAICSFWVHTVQLPGVR
ncbi:MAG: response regulator [Balneolaceae bacterium]|nr:MAG: response regulator [Balneolaceae bacterium]